MIKDLDAKELIGSRTDAQVIDIINAYKKIYKTENILTAMLMVTKTLRERLGEMGGDSLVVGGSAKLDVIRLLNEIEEKVYETINCYYKNGASVRDRLANIIFYINVLNLKELVSQSNFESLHNAYVSVMKAYEYVYKDLSTDKDIDMKLDLSFVKDSRGEQFLKDGISNFEENIEHRESFKEKDRYEANKRTKVREGEIREKERSDYFFDDAKNTSNNLNSKRQTTRRDEILKILNKTTPLSIKDIAVKIVGCSEKTVQR